jgi:hypothetical protein
MTSRKLFPTALLASLGVVAGSCGGSNVQEFTKPLPGSPAPIALTNIRRLIADHRGHRRRLRRPPLHPFAGRPDHRHPLHRRRRAE